MVLIEGPTVHKISKILTKRKKTKSQLYNTQGNQKDLHDAAS